ncbi:DUF485 domain-containing protein [Streptomyces chilikensis]|uniref:DUF485 domain-containing protein n=1 Tax=Streptomyces chilikensis TaxID=1194079 RepID=UPI00140CF756|nr:DUF485 domain-containing protein [Streptomyces chilikensis]
MSHDPRHPPYQAPPPPPPPFPAGQAGPYDAYFPPHDEHLPPHEARFRPFGVRPGPPRQPVDLAPLRAAYRGQRRLAGLVLLGLFTLYVLPAVFAPSPVGTGPGRGPGLGPLLVLLPLPLTVVVLAVWEHTARRRVDPLVDRAREPREEDR